MVSLYLDQNVSRRIVAPLQFSGHDVSAAWDASLARLPDDAQLLTAVRLGRVMVTHDRGDFTLLHDAWLTWPAAFGMALPPHFGILALDTAPPEILSNIIDEFLTTILLAELRNELFWWRRRDGWYRRLGGGQWALYSQGLR